ncbi:uncharacterized protein Pyn_10757 [Prunus yedoensis var. nudiflora]|uniref:Uncharacterized protein n=1 Tax=Prunus yedoensis var. nudiflora TaxID=2094558 RepID=A0A314YL74_PRUYE|nr:uncharacterized protein Pyn_10757 [Prunus yedoensis var. nudiflora]
MPLTRESSVEAELAVVESPAIITSNPPSLASVDVPMLQMPLTQGSTVVTELMVVGTSTVPSAIEEPASFEDLVELYASLHEEGGRLALTAPLDDDSKATIGEFRLCLDTAMALGLLDLAQLDELQVRLAEGEEMINRYAEAGIRMTEGCLLE